MFLKKNKNKGSVSVFVILHSAFNAVVENLFHSPYRSSSVPCWATSKGVTGVILFALFFLT